MSEKKAITKHPKTSASFDFIKFKDSMSIHQFFQMNNSMKSFAVTRFEKI